MTLPYITLQETWKRLSLDIEDVMRSGENNAVVKPDADLITIHNEITTKRLGAVTGVVDDNQILIGFITDFDIRKSLVQGSHKRKTAREIMNPNPSSFPLGMKAYDVLVAMEERSVPFQ